MASRNGRKVRWREPGTRRQRERMLRTEQRAEEFLQDRIREEQLVRDGYVSAEQVEVATGRGGLIAESLATFNADREYRRVTATEIRNTTALIQFVIDRCGWVRVADVNPVKLKITMRKLAKDRDWSARTVNRYSQCLRGLFNHMVEAGVLAESPCSVLDILDVGRDRRRVSRSLTVAESDALVNAAIDPLRRLLLVLRFRSGLRVLEAARLEWSDLDLDDGVIRLRPEITKNGRPGEIPIAADLDAEIADFQRQAVKTGQTLGGLIFPSVPSRPTWRRDLDRAGVPWKFRGEQADPKCTRRTFESHLLRSGAGEVVTMLLMRHTPRGGLGLTMGVYADTGEIARRKRAAIDTMTAWQVEQRQPHRIHTAPAS